MTNFNRCSAAMLLAVLFLAPEAQAQDADQRAAKLVDQMSQDEQLALVKGLFPAFEKNVPAGATLVATFHVKNIGTRPIVDTPQLYAAVTGRDGRRIRRLVGWSRISLAPGRRQDIAIKIDPRSLANFDVDAQKWHVGAGKYELVLGKSATDQQAATDLEVPDILLAP